LAQEASEGSLGGDSISLDTDLDVQAIGDGFRNLVSTLFLFLFIEKYNQ
jgi:hypothetical protein